MSEKNIKKFYEVTRPIMKSFANISALVIIANMLMICCDVFMRYIFNDPISGVTEMVSMLMAWVAYSGLAYTLLEGKHMQLGAIYDKLKGRTKYIMSFIIFLLGLILYIVMIKASFNAFIKSWAISEKAVASVTVYVYIGKFAVLLGCILLAIQDLLMTVYFAYGVIYPDRVEELSAMSEIPTEKELEAILSVEDKAEQINGSNKMEVQNND